MTKRNVMVNRLDFFLAVQSAQESIDDFVTRLKVIAKLAKLDNLESELIAYKEATANVAASSQEDVNNGGHYSDESSRPMPRGGNNG